MMAWSNDRRTASSSHSQSEDVPFLDHCTGRVSFEDKEADEEEMEGHFEPSRKTFGPSHKERVYFYALTALGITNAISIVCALGLSLTMRRTPVTCDPLRIYSPANSVVEYEQKHFTAALFTKTPYMGFPTDETDRKWEELYNCISQFSTLFLSKTDLE
jgi:hypothetical protein